MPLAPKKTAQVILDSGNDYLGALHRQPIWITERRRSQLPTPTNGTTAQ